MKKKYLPIICFFSLLASCSGMNDIIQEYLDRGEINYIGCPDSLSTTGGNERIQLKWLVGKDPRIEGYIIYWNNRKDSVVGEIDHNNLDKGRRYWLSTFAAKEGSYEFEVIQTGTKGANSVISRVTGSTYGTYYISQLKARSILSVTQVADGAKITWGISNNCKYVDFTYDKSDGTTKTLRIPSETNNTILSDPKPFGTYSYSTFHIPGKDSLDVFKAPEVVSGNFSF